MPASKKPITKNQVVTHFAEKFELSTKAASSIIDEMAMLAIAETKKLEPSHSPALVNSSLLNVRHAKAVVQLRVKR